MYHHTDGPLRAMPLKTKQDAIEYMAAYRRWLVGNTATGNGAFIAAKSKPATVRAPDLCAKAALAEVLAEQCYWQMPFELASKRFPGIPLAKWQGERKRRGLQASVPSVSMEPGSTAS